MNVKTEMALNTTHHTKGAPMNKIATLLLATALTSCASLPQGATTNKAQITIQSAKGGAVGCAVGAIGAKLFGGNAGKGCIAAGAVGAIAAGVKERNQQIARFNQAADFARSQGIKAVVTTEQTTLRDDKGNSQQTPQVKGMTVDLAGKVGTGDAAQVIEKIAHLSDASTTPITITVKGKASDRARITADLRQFLNKDGRTTVKEEQAASPSLFIAPIPEVGGV